MATMVMAAMVMDRGTAMVVIMKKKHHRIIFLKE